MTSMHKVDRFEVWKRSDQTILFAGLIVIFSLCVNYHAKQTRICEASGCRLYPGLNVIELLV